LRFGRRQVLAAFVLTEQDVAPAFDRPDDGLLQRYLLGELPLEEEERLDELSIAEGEIAARLHALEYDLHDAYVRNELSAEERARYERVYEPATIGKRDVEVAQRLAETVRRQRAPRLNAAPSPWLRLLAAAAAIVLLVSAAAYLALQRQNGGNQPANTTAGSQPVIVAPPAVQPPPPAPPTVATVALHLAIPTRALNALPVLSIPAGTQQVQVTLDLEVADFASYSVAIRDLAGDRTVWRSESIPPPTPQPRALTFAVPASALQSRRYTVELRGVNGKRSELLGSYPFRVVLH
jgi:hypothetical protein